MPEDVRSSFDAWAECIDGALKKSDYLDKIAGAGFKNIKVVSQKPYTIDFSPELKGKIVSIQVEAHKKLNAFICHLFLSIPELTRYDCGS